LTALLIDDKSVYDMYLSDKNVTRTVSGYVWKWFFEKIHVSDEYNWRIRLSWNSHTVV